MSDFSFSIQFKLPCLIYLAILTLFSETLDYQVKLLHLSLEPQSGLFYEMLKISNFVLHLANIWQ